MKIVVDENIPFGREAFSTLGDVVLMAGRAITPDDLRDAEVLAVRSVTKVNQSLLEGTAVRGVVTATIGTDHLDEAWLDAVGVRHASAPGCNADSVADYITAALLHVAGRLEVTLEGRTLGVVGCGNVGSRVARRGRGLGMRVLENDPPLARKTGDPRYLPLEDLLDADFLTFHTPLEKEGPDATWHLGDAALLERLRLGAVVLNSSRGPVVDNAALKEALRSKRLAGAVLDVWEGEPLADPELVAFCDIATPHIAGYSFDGKINGITQVYQQVCEWLGVEPTWRAEPLLPPPEHPVLQLDAGGRPDEDVLREAVFTVYPISQDDGRMRAAVASGDGEARTRAFDRLRKEYPRRREFSLTRVELAGASAGLLGKFAGAGFRAGAADPA